MEDKPEFPLSIASRIVCEPESTPIHILHSLHVFFNADAVDGWEITYQVSTLLHLERNRLPWDSDPAGKLFYPSIIESN